MGLGSRLGTEFLPQLDEGVVWIRSNLAPGISLAKSAEIATCVRRVIAQSPEVRLVSSQTGRNDSGTDPFGPNRNEFFIALKPYDTWPPGANKRQLVERLAARLNAEIPGASFSFTQPIIDMVTESVTGSSADLAVILSGPHLGELRRHGARALDLIRAVPGAADTSIEQEADASQLQIEVDRERIGRFGINVADVQDLIEMAIGGKAVATMFEGERRFEIALSLHPGVARRSDRDRPDPGAGPGRHTTPPVGSRRNPGS